MVFSISLDMLSVQGNTGPLWKDKIPKLFWRGRDSSRERLKLISIGRQHQTLINASLTNFFFFRDVETEYGPKVDRVSFFEFFKVSIFYLRYPCRINTSSVKRISVVVS